MHTSVFSHDSSHIASCFVFVTKVVLVTHQSFSYFWTVLAQCEDICPTASRLGVGKKLRGDTVGTADPNRTKGYKILHDLVLSSKTWGKWRGRMHVCGYGVCLLRVPVHVLGPCFSGKCWTLLDNAVILLLQCGKGTRGDFYCGCKLSLLPGFVMILLWFSDGKLTLLMYVKFVKSLWWM